MNLKFLAVFKKKAFLYFIVRTLTHVKIGHLLIYFEKLLFALNTVNLFYVVYFIEMYDTVQKSYFFSIQLSKTTFFLYNREKKHD